MGVSANGLRNIVLNRMSRARLVKVEEALESIETHARRQHAHEMAKERLAHRRETYIA